MSTEKILAFVSSTSDLEAERLAVKQEISSPQVEVFLYEEVKTNSDYPQNVISQVIKNSEIFIGLLGGKYGSLCPPGNDKSIVEFEFEEARKNPDVGLMVFTKTLGPAEIEVPQQKFRSKIECFDTGVWRCPYDSVDKLRTDVKESIVEWLGNFFIKRKTAEEPSVDRFHQTVKAMAIAIMLLCIGLAIGAVLVLPFTGKSIAVSIICLTGAIICCMFALWS